MELNRILVLLWHGVAQCTRTDKSPSPPPTPLYRTTATDTPAQTYGASCETNGTSYEQFVSEIDREQLTIGQGIVQTFCVTDLGRPLYVGLVYIGSGAKHRRETKQQFRSMLPGPPYITFEHKERASDGIEGFLDESFEGDKHVFLGYMATEIVQFENWTSALQDGIIIMLCSSGVFVRNTTTEVFPVFEHRGIFRNPYLDQLIFPKSSVAFHMFMADALQNKNGFGFNLEYLLVKPTDSMVRAFTAAKLWCPPTPPSPDDRFCSHDKALYEIKMVSDWDARDEFCKYHCDEQRSDSTYLAKLSFVFSRRKALFETLGINSIKWQNIGHF